ncbi:hypothetical protein, partial [Clostridioides difficile]|uniref:hypothetical protein n=1 Tax=Clostridioides difficile TaxID=1496 RepID=UPI001A901067
KEMEKRILKVLLSKSGSGSLSPKISLPATWIKEMNITQEEREIFISTILLSHILNCKIGRKTATKRPRI